MDWTPFWQPRHPVRAARTGAAFIATVSVLSLVFVPLMTHDASALGLALAYVVPVLLIGAAGLLARFPHRVPGATCMLLVNFCVVLAAVLDILTRDASVGAQLLFFFPVFYAVSQLRAPAAVVTALIAGASQAVTVAVLEPPDRALTDFFYFAVTLACFTFLQLTAVSRQDALVQTLRRLADVDPLTGLASRRALIEATQAALRPVPPGGTAVISLDVDHFKVINDTYGHLVGDGVLVHLAEILRRSSRATDTVGRVGGDELMLLLPGCAEGSAHARADRLVRAVRDEPYVAPDGTQVPLSVSVGVAHVPAGAPTDPESVYALADKALYDAKRAGRGRVGGRLRGAWAVQVPTPRHGHHADGARHGRGAPADAGAGA